MFIYHYIQIYLQKPYLFSGNPFTCDCRLSWIYVLRNETKDSNLRSILERVSCVTDSLYDRRTDSENSESEDEASIEDDSIGDESYEEYGEEKTYEITNNMMYNDPTQSDDVSDKEVSTRKLTDIPLDVLPCPKELMQSMEETYGHPVQNEIRLKAFSKASTLTTYLCLQILKFFPLFLI